MLKEGRNCKRKSESQREVSAKNENTTIMVTQQICKKLQTIGEVCEIIPNKIQLQTMNCVSI